VTLGIGITVHKSRDAELSVSKFPFLRRKPAVALSLSHPSHLLNSSFIIMAGRKTLLAPIHFIFSLLQKRSTVSIWLYEQLAFRIEGKIRVSLLQSLPMNSSFSSLAMSLTDLCDSL
jgi:hypothetical protein